MGKMKKNNTKLSRLLILSGLMDYSLIGQAEKSLICSEKTDKTPSIQKHFFPSECSPSLLLLLKQESSKYGQFLTEHINPEN